MSAKCLSPNAIVKVLIETGLPTKIGKTVACKIIKEAGAGCAKTSNGNLVGVQL